MVTVANGYSFYGNACPYLCQTSLVNLHCCHIIFHCISSTFTTKILVIKIQSYTHTFLPVRCLCPSFSKLIFLLILLCTYVKIHNYCLYRLKILSFFIMFILFVIDEQFGQYPVLMIGIIVVLS